MSDDDNRLETESEEVQRQFANHPHISIVSTEGTPVNKYIVEYRTNGLVRLDDGEIAKSDQHRIEITLSFGFPHFPPNCKPLTQIFHPDIDPSAIKIAEFWTADETMAALIRHIGRMICWQVYSEENIFNQDAATWLAENSASVPLDDFDFSVSYEGDATGAEAGVAAGSGGEAAVPKEAVDIDLGLSADDLPELAFDSVDLGESAAPAGEKVEVESKPASGDAVSDVAKDLDFGFSAPDLIESKDESAEIVVEEINITAETPIPAPEAAVDEVEGEVDLDFATVDIDYDILRGMLDQQNYFAAQTKINATAPENLSQAAAGLRGEIETHIRDSEKIFQEAKSLEEQGQLEEAARKLEGVLNIARDYPELEENMKRVRNAWMASTGHDAGEDLGVEEIELPEPSVEVEGPGEIVLTLESEEEEPAVPEFQQPEVSDSRSFEQPMSRSSVPAPSSVPSSPGIGKSIQEKSQIPKASLPEEKPKKPLTVAGLAMLLVLAVSGWFYVEWTSFNKAKDKWGGIHALLERGEYDLAGKECDEIIRLLSRVHIVMASGKKELLGQVEDIVSSEHFQEAMGGKIYFKDKYISKKAHSAYLAIEKHVAEGEKQGSVSNWGGALVSYEAALKVAEENKKRLDKAFYEKVVFNVKQAQFANNVAQGKKAFIAKSWSAAIGNFEKAVELAKVKDVADPTSSYDVNRYLQRARFSQFLIDGDASLKKGDWKEAVSSYQGAYDIASKADVIDKASKSSVTLKLHQTTLMKGLTEGDKYAESKKWDRAVAEYEKAEKVMPYDVTIPGKSVAETQKQVANSLLSALVNREQESARNYFTSKEYIKAIAALKRMVRAIDSSSLKNKAQWQLIKKQAETDLKKAKLKGIVEEKTAYLNENYKEIFIENFVGVRAKVLDQPQVKFLENTGSALLFRVRCRELRDLKYYTLELIYQYDIAKDKWGFPGGD
ncbi:MAG: hypothetical protein ABFS09_12090 [Thermodesulfobacteriota bacterium]